jgi:transcriptional regulator with XRE-family HTH domain
VNGHPPACDLSLTAGANMRRIRKNRGWSQHRLATETGLAPCMISFLEAGERNFTLPTLERVARALKADPADLLQPLPVGDEGEEGW